MIYADEKILKMVVEMCLASIGIFFIILVQRIVCYIQ